VYQQTSLLNFTFEAGGNGWNQPTKPFDTTRLGFTG